jgi:cytoskeletal protein RodZ
MTTSKRLAAAPLVAFVLAFAVVLALGQFISSSSVSESAPASETAPPSETAQSPSETAQSPSETAQSPSEPAESPAGTGSSSPSSAPETSTSAPQTFDLGPLLSGTAAGDPALDALQPQVWREGDQVHVCLQVPDGWRIDGSDWTPAVGPVHCHSATSGEPLKLVLVRP